jgi:hypothetical protein
MAGIDVHKRMLAVVVSEVEVDGEYQFERRMFGSNPEQLRSLAAWLLEQEVEEVVIRESVTKNVAQRSLKSRGKHALRESSASSEPSATASNWRIRSRVIQ